MQDNIHANPIVASAANNACPFSSIGTSFDPLSKGYLTNPYPIFAQVRQSEPVFFSPMLNAWVVSRYDDIKAVLHDPKHFSSVGALETVVNYVPVAQAIIGNFLAHATVDPPDHTRIRAGFNKAFAAQRVARYEPLVRQLTNRLIDQFMNDGRADLVECFNYPLPALVIFRVMGVPEVDLKEVQGWCLDWIELLFSQPSPERQIECTHSAAAYLDYIGALIKQRRASRQDDLISDLVMTVDSGETHLSQEELITWISGLVMAGQESTAGLLGNSLYHTLRDRSLWQTICENPKLIPNVVEETLRFDGSAITFFRRTRKPIELGGVTLPEGARVIVLLSSASHDETQFPDPEVFNLERPNLKLHMGFGSGIHFCLGAPLARMEARVALELLSTRLPSLRLVSDQELNYKPNIAVRSLARLLVEWDVTPV